MQKETIKEIFKTILEFSIIFVIFFLINLFILSPFRINWSSMDSTYYDQELVFIEKISEVKRWDVVVFINQDKTTYYIKRVIWVSWDKIKIWEWKVFINWVEVDEPYLNEENKWFTFVWFDSWYLEFEVKEWEYFVMWDNREVSSDSRQCFWDCKKFSPFVKKEDILWKMFFDIGYFNIKKFAFENNDWVESFPRFLDTYKSHEYKELND